jgi:uncharacterized protein YuzB (UPF0349 family)
MKLMRNAYATHIDFFRFKGFFNKNPNATPSNLDMIFERKEKFLVGEWKRPNEKLSVGQEILLKNLAKQDNFTVLIINGDTDAEMVVHKFWRIVDGTCVLQGESAEDLKEFMNQWYEWADE